MTSRRKGEKLSDAAGDEYMGLGPGMRCEATEHGNRKSLEVINPSMDV